jgi:hypothetical protein
MKNLLALVLAVVLSPVFANAEEMKTSEASAAEEVQTSEDAAK